MTVDFLATVYNDALKHPNWFNGRILTGTDLREEQEAHVRRSWAIAQAIGSGVVHGLYVTASGQTVTVTGGLALSPGGDVLHLPGTTSFNLVKRQRTIDKLDSVFVPCGIGGISTPGDIDNGYYVLALTTASRSSVELAPTSALDGQSDAGCINKYTEVGVQFKLIGLGGVFFAPIGEEQAKARNELAHRCFGTRKLNANAIAPMDVPSRYGLLNELSDLTECDVPLAVIHFTAKTVRFVDRWAVRRPVMPAQRPNTYPTGLSSDLSAESEALSHFASPRRATDGAAMLLQFQDHLSDLATRITGSNVVARDNFSFLPPAGYLPIGKGKSFFNLDTFFSRMNATIHDVKLDPAYLRQIFHSSYYVDAINTAEDVLDVYEVEGADEDYRIFLRRQRVTVIEVDEESPDPIDPEIDPPVVRNGSLSIAVINEDGTPVDPNIVTQVTATNARGVQYTAQRIGYKPGLASPSYDDRVYYAFVTESANNTYDKYVDVLEAPRYQAAVSDVAAAYATAGTGSATVQSSIVERILGRTEDKRIDLEALYFGSRWRIASLPPGTYTVTAKTLSIKTFAVSSSVTVRQSSSQNAQVVLRQRRGTLKPEKEYIPKDDLPFDFIPKRWEYHEIWPEVLKETYPDLFEDPPIDDWLELDDPRFQLELEEWIGGNPGLDPYIVPQSPKIYVQPDFNPDVVSEGFNSVAVTQDGTVIPLVMVAADNATNKATSVTKAGLEDFDAGTNNALNEAGLGNMDSFVSAPSVLVAAVLNQSSASYANSLQNATKDVLTNGFANGFRSYVGVSAELSESLAETYGTSTMLANATATDLAENFGLDAGYAERLILDVRGSIASEGYSLGALGIGVGTQAVLAAEGITTTKGLVDLAAANPTRAQDLLGTTNIESVVELGWVNLAKSEYETGASKSIATLEGISREDSQKLAGLGLRDAKQLANADAEAIATETGIEISVIESAIESSKDYSFGYTTLVEGVTGSRETVTALDEAGYGTFGKLANADSIELGGQPIVDSGQATKLTEFSKIITGGSTFSGGNITGGRFVFGGF